MGARGRQLAEYWTRKLGLKRAEARVLWALGDICHDTIWQDGKEVPNNRCAPAKSEIAARIGCHKDTVRRQIKSLENRGVIDVIETIRKNGSSSSNTYVLRAEEKSAQLDLFGAEPSLGEERAQVPASLRFKAPIAPFSPPPLRPPPSEIRPRGGSNTPTPPHSTPPSDQTLTRLRPESCVTTRRFSDFKDWFRGIGGTGDWEEARAVWGRMTEGDRQEEFAARRRFEAWRKTEKGSWYTLPGPGKYLRLKRWEYAGPPQERPSLAVVDGGGAHAFVTVGSPQWEAWVAFDTARQGRVPSYVSICRQKGETRWLFDREWPPEQEKDHG